MPFFSSLDHLTWDKRGPAPYESAANVFLKVMVLNSLSFEQLCELIIRDQAAVAHFHSALFDGTWVDFPRYSSLLRVDQSRLREGFLNTIGIDFPKFNHAGIRHCPECEKLNYHCSLFNIDIINYCPWHGCPLRSPCSGCALQLSREGTFTFGWCANPKCRHGNDMSYLLDSFSVNRVPPDLALDIERYCKRLVGWWATVKQKQKGAEKLLADAVRIDPCHSMTQQKSMAMALDYAQGLAPFPVPWRHGVAPNAAKVVELRPRHEYITYSIDAKRYFQSQFSCVRRYVYKTFVKKHRRCFTELRCMHPRERYFLDGTKFCSVCVAYLSWLTDNRISQNQAPLPLMGLGETISLNGHYLDWGCAAEHILLRFIQAWSTIELLCEDRCCIVIDEEYTAPIDWPHVIFENLNDGEKLDDRFTLLLLRADEASLSARALGRCMERRIYGHAMVDYNCLASFSDFYWWNDDYIDHFFSNNGLCRIINPASFYKSMFYYIYI
jgi:hypothetical protein